MMPALHFRQRIAQRRQKILVGSQDFAVRREFDDGLRPGKGVDLAGVSAAFSLRAVMSVAIFTTFTGLPRRNTGL